MFTIVAAIIFFGATLLAIGTMLWMFATYHDKMVAALLFQPIPQEPRVYHIRISRRRAMPEQRQAPRAFSPAAFAV